MMKGVWLAVLLLSPWNAHSQGRSVSRGTIPAALTDRQMGVVAGLAELRVLRDIRCSDAPAEARPGAARLCFRSGRMFRCSGSDEWAVSHEDRDGVVCQIGLSCSVHESAVLPAGERRAYVKSFSGGRLVSTASPARSLGLRCRAGNASRDVLPADVQAAFGDYARVVPIAGFTAEPAPRVSPNEASDAAAAAESAGDQD